MKVLLPYFQSMGSRIDSDKIVGGIERFSQLIYKNLEGIIPVHFSNEDKQSRGVVDKIVKAALANDVDVIISNYDSTTTTTTLQKRLPHIPIMNVCHFTGNGPAIRGSNIILNQFALNGSLFFVSPFQYNQRNQSYRSTNDTDLRIDGYLHPSFCSGLETVSPDIHYQSVTVGRNDSAKNPFWLHKKAKGTGLSSLVITLSRFDDRFSGKNKDYYTSNLNWVLPQTTKYDLDHSDVLLNLSKSGLYVSTWPEESWGITALEALSSGCPLCLVTNGSNTHASEIIPSNSWHYCKVRSGIKVADFADIVSRNQLSYEQRVEISEQTKEKHSKDKWKMSILSAIDQTTSKHKSKNRSSIRQFFL